MARTIQIKIDDETLAVLRKCPIYRSDKPGPWHLYLGGALERKLYLKVDKVLKALGGKWHKGAKAHLFQEDPRAAFMEGIAAGAVVDEKKTKQQFFTPPDAAAFIEDYVLYATSKTGRALEPSAGQGALAKLMGSKGWAVDVCEIDAGLQDNLRGQGFDIVGTDFLELPDRDHGGRVYDLIVMNPPFTAGQAEEHLLAAWRHLRIGGRLLAVMPSGTVSRTDRKAKEVQALIEEFGLAEPMPEGSFKESGTGVSTVLLVLDK